MEDNKGRLLVVEDDADISAMLGLCLQQEGYEVRFASSVTEAKQCLVKGMLDRQAIDLVIADWQLPDGTGANICASVRSVDSLMPVVVISGVIGRWDMKDMEYQGDAYLEKPLDLNTLRHTVQRLLKWRYAEKASSEA